MRGYGNGCPRRFNYRQSINPGLDFIDINVKRLRHVLKLFGLSEEALLTKLNEGRKTLLTHQDIFSGKVSLNNLQRIDQLFDQGLSWYVDEDDPITTPDASIFFRKERFNADLNFRARKRVNQFEREKIKISAISKLADFNISRTLPVYSVKDDALRVATELRRKLALKFKVDRDKENLERIIKRLADENILVFEFVETHNVKEPANIEGVFIAPNTIVLKRNQKYLRREIFTLAHELGHYLLAIEEIDQTVAAEEESSLNQIEKWCNDFAFHFLVYDQAQLLDEIKQLPEGKAKDIERLADAIYQGTPLSKSAIYYYLNSHGLVSKKRYAQVRAAISKKLADDEEAARQQRLEEKQKAKEMGVKPVVSGPKPIISPLYLSTLKGALYSGIISEREFCERMRIKPDRLDKYLR